MTPEAQALWDTYVAAHNPEGKLKGIDQFGDSPAMADDLVALVLSGDKRATCDLLRNFEIPPKPGDHWIITDGKGTPRCIIETVSAHIQPFKTVTADFAFTEGEGNKSLDYWWREHVAYFERQAAREGWVFTTDMPAVFEVFHLVWPQQKTPPV